MFLVRICISIDTSYGEFDVLDSSCFYKDNALMLEIWQTFSALSAAAEGCYMAKITKGPRLFRYAAASNDSITFKKQNT